MRAENSKNSLRQTALSLRAELDITTISAAIRAHLAAWSVFRRAGQVLLYHPLPGEVDLMPLVQPETRPSGETSTIQPLPETQKKWYLPAIVDGANGEEGIVFHAYQSGDPLRQGPYRILEPDGSAAPFEDESGSDRLILLPGLGFDRRGYRLGYGKGYFDRFLQRLAQTGGACVPVGVIPQALLHEILPDDPWDIPARFIVTEEGIRAALSG